MVVFYGWMDSNSVIQFKENQMEAERERKREKIKKRE